MEDMQKKAKEVLIELVQYKMPFGKYAGRSIAELPEHYLTWFHRKGWPPGKVGFLMQNAYEIKLQGMDPILRELVRRLKK